jgi:hypothetical protein
MSAWSQPSEGVVPGIILVREPVSRSATIAIWLLELRCYSNGLEFDLVAYVSPDAPEFSQPIALTRPAGKPESGPPEMWALWIEIGGETGATLVSAPVELTSEGFSLIERIGTGDSHTQYQTFWLTPLPPPDSQITLRCGWPARGLPAGSVTVPSGTIDQAVASARSAWG